MTRIVIDDFEKKMEQVRAGFAFDLAKAMRDKLTIAFPPGGFATGILKANIVGKVEGDHAVVEMPEYGKNVEWGTPPGTPPSEEDILEWVKVKGIQWGNKKPETIAKIISRSIGKKGTKMWQLGSPRPIGFIRSTIDNDFTDLLRKRLAKVFNARS